MRWFILLTLIAVLFLPYFLVPSDEPAIARAYEELHWTVFGLVMLTCYYFRSVSEKSIAGHPKSCTGPCSSKYKGDRFVYKFHRYLVWIALVFALALIVTSTVNVASVLLSPESSLLRITRKLAEVVTVSVFLLYLLGCHHIRFVLGRMAEKDRNCRNCMKRKIYTKQSWLNARHDYLFWFSFMAIIAFHIFILMRYIRL